MTLRGLLKHVAVLEQAGLVQTSKVGRTRFVRLAPGAAHEALAWLATQAAFAQRFDTEAPFIDLDNIDVT